MISNMGDAFPNCHLVRGSRDHNYVQPHAELALVLHRVEAGNTQICSDCLNQPMPRKVDVYAWGSND